jgi:hypothetical protein
MDVKPRTYQVKIVVPAGAISMVMYSMDEAGRISAVLQSQGWTTTLQIGIPEPFVDPKSILVLVLRWDGDERGPLLAQALRCQAAGILAQGRIATTRMEKILKTYSALTAVVIGEAEQTTPQALAAMESGAGLESIPGLAFMRGGELVKTPARLCLEDLDTLPLPDRRYLEPDFGFPFPIVPIESSRGCRGACLFCTTNQSRYDPAGSQQIRMRAPAKVVDELAEVIARFHKNIFYFVSDNFFALPGQGRAWALALADEIQRRGLNLHYHIECRVDDVEPALFEKLKASGLKHVFLGLESGSQRALDRYGKGTTVAQNRQAAAILNSLGIDWSAGFIFYDPCLTWAELGENIEFVAELKLLEKGRNSSGMKGMTPYPGTAWERLLLEQGIDPAAEKYPFQDSRAAIFVRHLQELEGRLVHWMYTLQQWQQQADRLMNEILEREKIPGRYKFRIRLPEILSWQPWHQWLRQCRSDEPDFMRQIYRDLSGISAESTDTQTDGAAESWLAARARSILGQMPDERAREIAENLLPANFHVQYQKQSLYLSKQAS